MPVAFVNERQLKNFTVIIPTDYDLDNILLVKFIQDFRRPGAVPTNNKQVG
jgi:hypothetical protein